MPGPLVVSVPPPLVPSLRERAASVSGRVLRTGVRQPRRHPKDQPGGPHGHRGPPIAVASVIREADDAAIAARKAEVPAEGWDDASIDENRARGAPVLAVMAGEEIASLASYEMRPGSGANPGIAVHPRHRRHGLGKTAFAAITEYCRQEDLLPVLQTLESNPRWSVAQVPPAIACMRGT